MFVQKFGQENVSVSVITVRKEKIIIKVRITGTRFELKVLKESCSIGNFMASFLRRTDAIVYIRKQMKERLLLTVVRFLEKTRREDRWKGALQAIWSLIKYRFIDKHSVGR